MNTRHRFLLEVENAPDIRTAEMSVLSCFAKRQPDGLGFSLRIADSAITHVGATTKPPLGVAPQKIWRHQRCQDLARAIHEHFEAGIEPDKEWIKELSQLHPLT